MVGNMPLEHGILVRIQAPELWEGDAEFLMSA